MSEEFKPNTLLSLSPSPFYPFSLLLSTHSVSLGLLPSTMSHLCRHFSCLAFLCLHVVFKCLFTFLIHLCYSFPPVLSQLNLSKPAAFKKGYLILSLNLGWICVCVYVCVCLCVCQTVQQHVCFWPLVKWTIARHTLLISGSIESVPSTTLLGKG